MCRIVVRRLVLPCVLALLFEGALLAQWETRFLQDGSSPGQEMGLSVAGGLDFNNDGVGDILVGSPSGPGFAPGSVNVFGGPAGTVLFTTTFGTALSRYGEAVAAGGRINLDPVDDIIVSAPEHSNGLSIVLAYSGPGGGLIWSRPGFGFGDRFGASISAAGDLNGDLLGDVLVGAPLTDAVGIDSGKVYILSGAAGAVLNAVNGNSAGDQFGYSVSGPADLNGDSIPDGFLVGAPGVDCPGSPDCGAVYVILYPSLVTACTILGGGAGNALGTSVAVISDVNGDGKDDFVIGAPGANSSQGQVFLFAGSPIFCAQLCILDGQAPGDEFGAAVSGAGDQDDDGREDFIVGAPGHLASTGKIYAYHYVATISGPECVEIISSAGTTPGERKGASVSGAGNFDGLGLDEVVAGSPNANAPSAGAGKVMVHSIGFKLWAATAGFGDLTLQLVNIPLGTIEGYTIFSFDTSLPVGGGPVFGLLPDALSVVSLEQPVAPGSPFHWAWPVALGFYPESPLYAPVGALSAFIGQSLDSLGVGIVPGTPLGFEVTPVVRVTF